LVRSVLPAVLTIVLLVVLVQFLIPEFHIPQVILPLPSVVFSRIFASNIPWLSHLYVTLYEALGGFFLAVILGIPLAMAIYLSRPLGVVVEPIILAAQVAPKIVLVPILFLWLGFAPLPRVLTVFLLCFFPIVIDTRTGLASVEPDMVEMVKSFNSSRLELLRKVSFPTALPSIFSGLKISITLAMLGAVVAEFVSSSSGLGYLILSSQATLDTALAFASIVVLVAISLVLYGLVLLAEELVITWR